MKAFVFSIGMAAILAAPRDQVAGLGSRGLVEIGVVR